MAPTDGHLCSCLRATPFCTQKYGVGQITDQPHISFFVNRYTRAISLVYAYANACGVGTLWDCEQFVIAALNHNSKDPKQKFEARRKANLVEMLRFLHLSLLGASVSQQPLPQRQPRHFCVCGARMLLREPLHR